jgi:hypothetical protein
MMNVKKGNKRKKLPICTVGFATTVVELTQVVAVLYRKVSSLKFVVNHTIFFK